MHDRMPRLPVEFTKMNGAGNDFIVIDNRPYRFSDDALSRLAQRLCSRRTGIGADGLLGLAPSTDVRYDFRMRYVNADGSFGTMCANGARCLARYARRVGRMGASLTIEGDAGPVRAEVPEEENGPVRVLHDAPGGTALRRRLRSVEATTGDDAHYVWTGTEHLVCFVNGLRNLPVPAWGQRIRRDEALEPAGANVDFVEVVDVGAARLAVRTYEKGVEAETLACGTGAMAAATVAYLLGHVQSDRIEVLMPGGLLTVGLDLDGARIAGVWLEGPAEVVYRGTVEIDRQEVDAAGSSGRLGKQAAAGSNPHEA